MDQTGEQDEQQPQQPQDTGLALGIDFGNSKISAAVWDINKKIPLIVIDPETKKYQFPATIYFTGSKQSSSNKKSNNNDIGVKNENEYKVSNDEDDNQNKENGNIENNNGEINADVGVDFQDNYNLEYYVYDIKKLIGQTINEENDELNEILKNIKFKYKIENGQIYFSPDGNYYSLDKIAKLFIEKIKKLAENQFKGEVKYCTISVPHGFNHSQKLAIKKAARYAGISEIFIINDPLSTAIYYASKNKIHKKEYFLIIDFGSSKLDVSIVSINQKNSIQILNSGGDSNLGGSELNIELENDVLDNYKNEGGSFNLSDSKFFLLKQAVEKAKKDLTFKLDTQIKINKLDGKIDLKYSIKRDDFDDLNREIYTSILSTIDNLILETGIKIENIDHVILQGDAIRVVALTSELQKKFQDSDVIIDLYDSVACGSAIYTAKKLNILNNPQFNSFKIYDITPLSLGIRTEGDLMSVIVPRGMRIPIKVEKIYVTTPDKQNCINFEIYEGERQLIKDNIKLERTMLKQLNEMNKGQLKVSVIFEIDEEGKLTCTAKTLDNEKKVKREVFINENLTQNDILDIVNKARENEEEDLEEKERIQSMLKLNDKIFEYSHLYEGNEDILRELEVFRNWIKHNSSVQKKEYEKKLSELNETMQKKKNDSKLRKQTATGSKKTITTKHEEEKNPENK